MSEAALIPKAEIHLHLEGATPPGLALAMAASKNIDLSGAAGLSGYRQGGFESFLHAYDLVASLFDKPEEYAALTEAYLMGAHAQGALYVEIFAGGDLANIPAQAYYEAIDEGAARAEAATGIVARIVPLAVRGLGPDQALNAAQGALDAAKRLPRVTGFGLAGDERVLKIADFAPAFAKAGRGLGLTTHIGEWTGPEEIQSALDKLGVTRIGHGIRAIEDPALVERLARDGVTLELCPGSNVALGAVESWAAHPLPLFHKAGVKITLNSDDPPFFNSSLSHEYAQAQAVFGVSDADLRGFTRNALEAAFCDEETREKLLARI